MLRLVLATKNSGKVLEITELLRNLSVEVVECSAYKDIPEIVEDGETFEDNATSKALGVAKATGEISLADDSGLEVDALHGAPGVYSARFAGETLPRGKAQDRANCEKLLSLLEGVEDAERTARFRCVVAIATPDGTVKLAHGVCEGRIAFAPSGSGGFGYDPVFIPNGYSKSFAELPQEMKNRISHRSEALKEALPLIEDIFRR